MPPEACASFQWVAKEDRLFIGCIIGWLCCCTLGFTTWLACIRPSNGTCAANLARALAELCILVAAAVIAVASATLFFKCGFDAFFRCMKSPFFARMEDLLDRHDVTWSWPTRYTVRKQRMPELLKDPRFIAQKQRMRRRFMWMILALALFLVAYMAYIHHHFLLATVTYHWQDLFTSDDPYVILGVSQNASIKDVKRAYRRTMLRCHPEKAEYFVDLEVKCSLLLPRVDAAWNILKNETLRSEWDSSSKHSLSSFLQRH